MYTLLLVLGLAGPLLSTGVVGAQEAIPRLFELFGGGKEAAAPAPLPASQLAAGLKAALRLGTELAVSRLGREDGFLGEPRVRIPLPRALEPLETGLRLLGQGERVKALEVQMNRAAERAVPAAKSLFWDAIATMSFADARQILAGGDTAATEFFKAKAGDGLYAAFRPTVDETLRQLGTVQAYQALLDSLRALPFLRVEAIDLSDYVTRKALDGLFLMVAEEEKRLRRDPAARVTELLRRVFGHQAQAEEASGR
ncbi:MAG: hypothetical protein KatS3mg131_3318 [Candidatus Tectimicrobiota bacterium]|nr:MAG: hypothetical protein KatS3mg131_3318 [Candidatus Tectomicrobia bacterium]